VKPHPLIDALVRPALRVAMPRAPRLYGLGCRGDRSLRSGGAPPMGSEREAKRGLDGNCEGGGLGLLPGPGGAALKIQERIPDDHPGARVQMHEDPRIPRPPTSPRGLEVNSCPRRIKHSGAHWCPVRFCDRNVPAYVLYEENNPARVTYSAFCVPLALLFADPPLRFAQ